MQHTIEILQQILAWMGIGLSWLFAFLINTIAYGIVFWGAFYFFSDVVDKYVISPAMRKLIVWAELVYFFRNKSRILAFMKRERELRRSDSQLSPEEIILEASTIYVTSETPEERKKELVQEIYKIIQSKL